MSIKTKIIIAIFINSDGCKFKKYKFNHLLDPEEVIPKNITKNKSIRPTK